jgi:hypothetical protein
MFFSFYRKRKYSFLTDKVRKWKENEKTLKNQFLILLLVYAIQELFLIIKTDSYSEVLLIILSGNVFDHNLFMVNQYH